MEKYVYAHHNFNNNFWYEWWKWYNDQDKKLHRNTIEQILSEINLPHSAYKWTDNLWFYNDEFEYLYFFPWDVTMYCKLENYVNYMAILNHYFDGLDNGAKQTVRACHFYSDQEIESLIKEFYTKKRYINLFESATDYDGLANLKKFLLKETWDVRLEHSVLWKFEDDFMNKVFDIFDKIK